MDGQALARYRGLDIGAAAWVMSGEMLGIMVSTAVVAPALRRFDRRCAFLPEFAP
jgi:hypothetical protein